MGHRANRGIVGAQHRSRPRRRALDELANGLIPKVLVGVRLGDGREHALARMLPRQAEHALNEANRADAAGGERRVGPLLERRPDALALADEAIDVGLLTRRGLGLSRARRKHAVGHARVHRDERVAVEDAHQMRVPAHADLLAEQRERHRIEGAADFDVAIGVDGALATAEERKALGREGLQRRLLDLEKVRPDLAPRRPVNAEPRDRAIPVPQERILRVETVEAPALQRVVFDVAATALLFPVFLRGPRLRRNGVKPQCAAKAR